jgi:formate/nitrite transporter FocA (FNT family)
MLFGAGIMLHRLLTYYHPPRTRVMAAIVINILICLAIWAHIQAGESTFHQIVFAGMMLTSAFTTANLITTTVKEEALRKQMRAVGTMALCECLFSSSYLTPISVFTHHLPSYASISQTDYPPYAKYSS